MAMKAAPNHVGAGAAIEMMADMEGAEPEVYDLAKEVVEVSRTGLALTYDLRQLVSVPSDGTPHKVSVANLRLSLELDYLSAPRVASYAYRRAKVENSSPMVLLPGRLAVFWGAEYVGASHLDNIAPGQTFEVFLGVDERVRVERDLVEREVDRRLLGNRRTIRYVYRMTVENLADRDVRLTLLDQMPVSRHEDVNVMLVNATLPPEQKEMGILEWDLTLGVDEKREIVFGFTVEYPREMVLTGLS